ncbi:hypothetical protein J3R82DRAFT_6638 [Butyriboletus roseoflavus]|nr:hypothetical protein J3R82DRAFT_6638 [Butyriboletus roseoflavus]
MPPKRRGAQAKMASLATKPGPPEPSKPSSSSKSPVETDATKVRKEWSKFIDAWYEPQKKKLVEKLQKDLLVKYKSLGSAKETQKLREMELFEKLDSMAQQLAQPARTEWERRLELAQLREDQWDDMSGEEQHAVMSVFVGFFGDEVDDVDDDDISPERSSIGEEESVVEEPYYRGIPSYPPSAPSASFRHPIPPTPIRGNFEFVNPTSFFADTMTPPNPTKNLPALSMDHLATLGPSNAGRSADPASASVGGMLSFQNWASEVGIATQPPQAQSPKPPPASSAQTLSVRPRATDNMSRQASAASNLSSPPFNTSSPQYSPPNPTTKFSPPTNAENLPLGKRYIGPVIMDEEPDPMDEDLLKSKMADEYQQYKISLRIQMIYQFHAEAAEFEIKLVETLLTDQGTKESRARAVQEHETSMMRLREQKEEERKRLCAEERERRREEIRHHLAQRRSAQNREVDPGPKANPPKPLPDKTSVPQRPGKVTHQKENVPLSQPAATSSTKLEPPSIIKKSNSSLSQDEASANESFFANAMAMMSQEKSAAAGLNPAQASQNEALFSNAAAMLAAQGPPGNSGKSTLQPPSIMKKSNSSRSQEYDIPQITVSFADFPIVTPEPAQVPPATGKGKKGKKRATSIVITEEPEPEIGAEPPPSAPSLWDAASVTAKNAWGSAPAPTSASKTKLNMSVEDEWDLDLTSTTALPPPKGNANAKKSAPAAKKGKKAKRGGWGPPASSKSKATPPVVEESEADPAVPPPPPVTPAWGKKTAQAATKSAPKPQQLKVAISEEQESEVEQNPVPARKNKSKSAWGVPSATPGASTSTQAERKTTQQQVEPRRDATSSGFKSPRVNTVPDPEDEWPETAAGDHAMPGTLEFARSEEAQEEEEGDANAWYNPENISYWANFMAGQPETETEAVPEAPEQTGKHVLWTPTVGEESEDEGELGEADQDLATNMWMQYAVSGGDIPSLGKVLQGPQTMPSEEAQRDTSLWEQGKGKKLNPTTGDFGNRTQQTSVFDRAALTGQWPKMENWLAPPSRGQNSGSTRVF